MPAKQMNALPLELLPLPLGEQLCCELALDVLCPQRLNGSSSCCLPHTPCQRAW